jgi:TonB-linked SusC/RagA family outer membrane protein
MWCLATAAAAWWLAPAVLRAQGGAPADVVPFTGRIVASTGAPVPFAQVVLPTLSLVTQSREDGRFTINIPTRRVDGTTVPVNVRALSFKPYVSSLVLKAPIEPVVYTLETNPLHLGEVVVTGLGTTSSSEKLGTVRTTIDSTVLTGSNQPNVVDAMAASAPGVNVTSNAGDPGASASIRLRGENTLNHTPDPLFVVDGIPINNSTETVAALDPQTGGPQGGVASPNRAIDINPEDIASIEVLKGAAAGAIYGARAGQGVVLITTKSGRGGKTTTTLNSDWGFSNVESFPKLQREFGEGSDGQPDPCITGGFQEPACRTEGFSWGPQLAPGTPTYDHSDEVFTTGSYSNNDLTISGGDTKTTFYASGGYTDQVGDVIGPHNYLHRSTVRLKADREVLPGLTVTGNMSFANTAQDAVQKGYNYSSITLTSWLTPPDFNNLPVYNQYGQQRSFRLPFPTPLYADSSRGYDDPFFSAENNQSTTNTNRTISNGSAVWDAARWLKFQENIGVDYSHDNRIQGQPIGNSQTALPNGQVIQQDFDNFQFTNTLTGTVKWAASPNLAGSVVAGQDANTRSFQGFGAVGDGLYDDWPYSLNNTIGERIPVYSYSTYVHDLGYFSQATLDLQQQLYLKAGLRYDGTSTLADWGWYPSGSVAWDVTSQVHSLLKPISYAKLRVAYGQVGTEPLPYENVHYYCAACAFNDVFSASNLAAIGANGGGLFTPDTEPGINPKLKVERTGEFETGADFGFLKDRADLSLTYYHRLSTDVILPVVLAASSGYTNQWQNGATIRNDGVEYAVNVRPIQTRDVDWNVGFMYAANWNMVTKLKGADYLPYGGLGGFGYSYTQLGGTVDAFRGYDYVRCGRGINLSGYNVDAHCTSSQNKNHALFLDDGTLGGEAAGFPILDPTQRYLGNPDPKWTGNLHTSIRWKKWKLSALFDIKEGGLVYDQTQQVLDYYGTSLSSAQLRGKTVTFGQNYMKGPVAGPGAGTAVTLDQNWFQNYLGGIEPQITAPYLIDGSYIKLRELALSYIYNGRFLTHNLGLSEIDLRAAARNLVTWSHYPSGDPEVNAGGAETGAQGIDFFGIPQTRSFTFTVTIIK